MRHIISLGAGVQSEVEFDRLLLRLRIIKDWVLRGAKPIGDNTQHALAADIELAHKMIEYLHDELTKERAFASGRTTINDRHKIWNDAMERAAQIADAYADLYKSQAANLIAGDCRACRLPLPSPADLGLTERSGAP